MVGRGSPRSWWLVTPTCPSGSAPVPEGGITCLTTTDWSLLYSPQGLAHSRVPRGIPESLLASCSGSHTSPNLDKALSSWCPQTPP